MMITQCSGKQWPSAMHAFSNWRNLKTAKMLSTHHERSFKTNFGAERPDQDAKTKYNVNMKTRNAPEAKNLDKLIFIGFDSFRTM